MKNRTLNLIFFLIFTASFFSQEKSIKDLLITYQLDYKNIPNGPNYTNHDYFYLNISENLNKSIFISTNKKKSDSLYKIGGLGALFELKKIKLNFSYKIFFDLLNKDMTTVDNIGARKFFYISKNSKIDWKITNERKNILNYIAQKATCEVFGRKWIAWFINDISIPEGPYKFKGLPGLIIEIYDESFNYKFSILEIKKSNEIILNYTEDLKDAKELSPEEFNKSRSEIYDNPYISIPNYDSLDDNMKERIKNIMKIKKTEIGNNPIELSN